MESRARGGLTRVELIVVVVTFGIVAGVALPEIQWRDTDDAGITAVKSMGGALRSAANRAHSVCMAQACANDSVIVIEGNAITFVNGYPSSATIGNLVRNVDGFTANAAGDTFARNGSRTEKCWVRYTEATAGQEPTISYQAGTITNAASETLVNNALRQQC
jgi:MSHA pilin protein MshA